MTPRAWVLLPSGQRLDLLAPSPDSWSDRDLAIGLSRTYRWGGHSRWDLPLSVAQHSLLVLVLRQQMQAMLPLTRVEALRELLHDAEEGLIGFDAISPLKPHLGVAFGEVTDRLRTAIDARYRLAPWAAEDYLLHKHADGLAAASEAFHVTGWSRADIRDSLLITIPPMGIDPMPLIEGVQPWEPWPPRLAAALFLAKLQDLQRTHWNGPAPGDIAGVIDRERTVGRLAAAFAKLPTHQLRRCQHRLSGSSLSDTYIYAEADDSSLIVEGVVVDGQRDDNGQWDFDADFTIFTTDEELIVCHGYNCHVELQ